MAKQSGLGDLIFVGGFDLSGDVGSVSRIGDPSTLLDVTAIQSSGYERIYGLYDGEISFNSFFNDANDQEHEALAAKGAGADRVVSYFKGSAIGNMAAGLLAKQINYDWTRAQDGSFVASIQALGNGHGLDYCQQLTAGKRTDASATNGSAYDSGIVGGTASGLAAYIHVFSLTSGSPTVKIQESSDNGADAYADVTGGSFGVVTAQTSARILTSMTLPVERYLRVVTTGTFSGLVFAVSVTRYPYA